MNPGSWLRHSHLIAQAERTRGQRQPGHSSTWRTIRRVALIVLSIGGGIAAYVIGQSLTRGELTLPFEAIQAAVVAGFVTFLWTALQRTSNVNERINTDHLLTTVGAHEVALGIVFVVYRQVAFPVLLPALSVAVGFAAGSQIPSAALTIVVAVAGFVTLAALLGIVLSLAADLAAIRSPRLRRYRNYTYVLAFMLGFLIWMAVIQAPVSTDAVLDWLRLVPIAWFGDLALLTVPTVPAGQVLGLGALVVTVIGIPVLTVLTIGLARHVWTTSQVSASMIHRSRSLVRPGVVELLFAGWVSRPALTVARKRWLQERRVPLGLLFQGYLLMLMPVVFLPIFAAGEVPGVSLVALAALGAIGAALAFGVELVGTEYSSLLMTLTSVPGHQFIRGIMLAGIAVSAPITTMGVLGLGVLSPLGPLELLLIALVGVVLCVCSVTLGAALGTRRSYFDIRPVPIPFTDITAYTGGSAITTWGGVFVVIGLVCLPAFVVYGAAFFNGPAASAFAISTTVVRIGSLVLTILLAGGITVVAYRRAVTRFNEYKIP